jgi:protein-tyrosine-phosphatase
MSSARRWQRRLPVAFCPANTYIRSAGVRAGERDPFVDVVLDEIGLSLGRHHPHTLEELEDDYFDLIITLSPQAHHAALELTRSSAVDVVYWPTMDPTVDSRHAGSDSAQLSRGPKLISVITSRAGSSRETVSPHNRRETNNGNPINEVHKPPLIV